MIIDYTINSKKLILKTLNDSNADSVYLSWMNDKEVLKYLEIRDNPPKSTTELSHYIYRANVSNDTLLLGIFLKKGMIHIGNIKLDLIDVSQGTADVGFIIGDKRYWGCGYATEAITTIANYAFNNMGLEKLIAGCYKQNIGSIESLSKSGFLHDKTLHNHIDLSEKRREFILFSKKE